MGAYGPAWLYVGPPLIARAMLQNNAVIEDPSPLMVLIIIEMVFLSCHILCR